MPEGGGTRGLSVFKVGMCSTITPSEAPSMRYLEPTISHGVGAPARVRGHVAA